MENSNLIFMLDDDVLFLKLYKNLFEAQGYRVFATDNAYKFLQYSREIVPGVFLIDINMPEMNGWEVLEILEREGKTEETPVVVMTVISGSKLSAVKGAAHFLNKPIELDLLYEILEVYVRGGREYDILLIEDYNPRKNEILKKKIKNCQRTVFAVHDFRAARKYLHKNKAGAVWVCKDEAEYPSGQLGAGRIVRLGKDDNLVDIEKLLR